jgi:membrane-associated phospholipid phosphatase
LFFAAQYVSPRLAARGAAALVMQPITSTDTSLQGRTKYLLAVLCFPVLFAPGCATLPSGRGWGADATLSPGWDRVGMAAKNAATDPWVWGPLAGAAFFRVDDLDRRTSDWAREHTPVFGSQQNAEDWSDTLRSAASVAGFATLLATPSGDDAGEWITNKIKGGLVDVAAIGATSFSTRTLKSVAGRERPNAADLKSFPSGHASSAAVHARLATINLESIDMHPTLRSAADIGLHAVSFGTGWARIESGWHYPSDTLAGMALGNFFAAFFNQAFLGDDGSRALSLSATDGGAVLEWQWSF